MISVIVTTCNRPLNIIERAVQSVFNQTYKDWELIVVDDSPDTFEERRKVVEYFQNLKASQSIIYLKNEKNSGACFSRNRGLEEASGEYVAYLDDDDEWLPDKLKLQYEAFKCCSPQVAMMYCSFYFIDQRNGEKQIISRHCGTGKLYDQLWQYGDFIGGTSVPLIRASCLKDINGFDVEMQSCQDYDVWLRLAQKYEIEFVSEPLVNYYMHYGQAQITTNHKKQICGGERIIEKNRLYLSKHRKELAARYRLLIPHYAAEKMYFKAIKTWIGAVAKCPSRVRDNCKALYSIIRYFFINIQVKS